MCAMMQATAEAVQPAIGTRSARRWIVRFLCAGGLVLLGTWLAFRAAVAWWTYPTIVAPSDSTRIEDRNGVELADFVALDGQWRITLSQEQISAHLFDAIVAVEDARFADHHGVDWWSVAGAFWQDLTHLSARRGASTLTMQLQRLRDPQPHTLLNKIEQAIRAEQIERQTSKRQILVEYLNRAPFGGNLVGAGAASWRYFGRDCRQLSLGQAALLAGLPQSPNRLRPDRFPQRARIRRDHVLDRMLACGLITRRQRDEAAAEPIDAAWHGLPQDRAARDLPPADGALPALVAMARKTTGGVIHAALDSRLQRQAAMAARDRLGSLNSSGVSAVAVVVLDTATGQCLANVSLGAQDPALDLAQRRRSTGSALKPFIYAAAFDAGIYGPKSILSDSPAAWPGYQPNDFDRTFRGNLTAGEALAESRNIPAMVVLSKMGVESAVGLMDAAGLHGLARNPQRYGLSLAIGGAEATPMELAQAYAMLGRGGSPQHCLRPAACWDVLNALSDKDRTASVCPDAAASHAAWKTGTSSGRRDAWCAAVTRRCTVAVWMGNTRGEGSTVLVGQEAAAPLALQLIAMFDPTDEPWPQSDGKSLDLPKEAQLARGSLTIVRPGQDEHVILAPDLPAARQRLRLEAAQTGSGSELFWFIDGNPLPRAAGPQWWDPTPGMHQIRVVNGQGQSASARVTVQAVAP